MFIMKNVEYVYKNNFVLHKIPHLKGNVLEYKSSAQVFDFLELKRLIGFFASAENKLGNSKFINYSIDYYNEIQFADKLTYILLECFLYYLIVYKNKKINFNISKYKNTILTEGVYYSCIKYMNNIENFINKFQNSVSNFHFRKLIKYEDKKLDNVSFILSDILQFLETCGINNKEASNAAEISAELIDNALDHSQSDCLIDIDVSQKPYHKTNDPTQSDEFVAVNIAVINFSKSILGEKIRTIANSESEKNEQYEKLKVIKDLHEKYFDENYTQNNFYMMSAFQNKISSRDNSRATGGKGLTKLISQLQEQSALNVCYVVSNDMCLYFLKDHIKQDEQKWVGFNSQNDCKLPPDKNAIKKCPLNIIGTGYNLTFVFQKGE